MNEHMKHTLSFIIVMMISAVLIILGGTAFGGGLIVFTVVEAGMVIAASGAAIMTGRRPGETFALKIPRIRDFFGGLSIYLSALAAQSAAVSLLSLLSDKFTSADSGVYARYMGNSPPAAVLFVFCIMPAVCEELLFRGFAVTTLCRMMKSRTAVVIFTALIFAAMHFNAYKFVPVFILGAGFGYISVMTGSVVICILFHFINNALAVAALYLRNASDSALSGSGSLPFGSGGSPVYALAAIYAAAAVLLFFAGRAIFKKK
ncbi:MAG: CPBP family intramembrane metalloprotease [Clostridia bacterium]|nr:CPBP family intramembrane metalloprotease [Clostridia bacterium]